MNTETGQLKSLDSIPPEDRHKYIEVRRDLRAREIRDMQIRLYSPCGCGSGKKFKFCCKK